MESSLKVLFAGCGDIAVRAIAQLNNLQSDSDWQTLGMRRNVAKLPAGIDAIAGDIRDRVYLQDILNSQNIDVLVVTLTPNQMSDEGYRDSYVVAAQSIESAVKACKQRPRLIVWVSSTGVYGQNSGEWVNESAETNPVSFRGKRLLEAENVISSLPIASVIVRFSGIYGPGRNRLINQIKKGELVPEQPVSWTNRIHSDDCAGVIVHLLEQFSRSEHLAPCYIGTDDEPVPAYEMRRWLAAEIGVQFNGASQTESCGETDSSSAADNSGRRCSNQRLRDSGYEFLYPTYREGYRALLDGNDD
jgi:nucleoside-diphosphate-sugar epimerase